MILQVSTILNYLLLPEKPKQLKTEKPSRKQPERVGKNGPSDVIDISDGDEHEYKFPHDDYQFGAK